MIRAYGLAAALICFTRDAADVLRSLAGNGRPDSLDQHFATVPRDPEPTPPPSCGIYITHDGSKIPAAVTFKPAEPTPLYDAAMDFLRRSLAELEAVETVADLLRVAGEDVQ